MKNLRNLLFLCSGLAFGASHLAFADSSAVKCGEKQVESAYAGDGFNYMLKTTFCCQHTSVSDMLATVLGGKFAGQVLKIDPGTGQRVAVETGGYWSDSILGSEVPYRDEKNYDLNSAKNYLGYSDKVAFTPKGKFPISPIFNVRAKLYSCSDMGTPFEEAIVVSSFNDPASPKIDTATAEMIASMEPLAGLTQASTRFAAKERTTTGLEGDEVWKMFARGTETCLEETHGYGEIDGRPGWKPVHSSIPALAFVFAHEQALDDMIKHLTVQMNERTQARLSRRHFDPNKDAQYLNIGNGENDLLGFNPGGCVK